MKITKRLFYFHGWNSAIPLKPTRSAKMRAMLSFCRKNKYHFSPTNINYQIPVNEVARLVRDIEQAVYHEGIEEVVLVGTSLGGWFARIVQLRCSHLVDDKISIQAVAFNPAVNPAEALLEMTGKVHVNYESGKPAAWNRFDCEELAKAEAMVAMSGPYPFYVFVDKGDETIPWAVSRDAYKKMSNFTAYDGGSHRFVHAAEALNYYETNKINAFWT